MAAQIQIPKDKEIPSKTNDIPSARVHDIFLIILCGRKLEEFAIINPQIRDIVLYLRVIYKQW